MAAEPIKKPPTLDAEGEEPIFLLYAGGDESANDGLLDLLPEEMWLNALTFCGEQDLCAVAQTCRLFHRLSNDDSVWRTLYDINFPGTTFVDTETAYTEKLSQQPCYKRWQRRRVPPLDEYALSEKPAVVQVGGSSKRKKMKALTAEQRAANERNTTAWVDAWTEHQSSADAEKFKQVLFRGFNDPATVIKVIETGDPRAAVVFMSRNAAQSPFTDGGVFYDFRYHVENTFPEVPFGFWKQAYIDRVFMAEEYEAYQVKMARESMKRKCGKTCQLRSELDVYLAGFPTHPNESDDLVVDFGVPLLTSAKFVLDFMAVVNDIPEFGETAVLHRALVRYHQFMLLYAENQNLHPTLDIDVIWQAHLIRTQAYHGYCAAVAGRLLGRTLVLPDEEVKLRLALTERVWREAYGTDYFVSIDELAALPLPDTATGWPYTGKAVDSLIRGTIKDRDWLPSMELQYSTSEVNWSDEQLYKRALKAYEKFLYLTATRPDYEDCPGPTDLIDLMWHAHQMHADVYAADSTRLTGKLLDHSPWPETSDDAYARFSAREEDLWRSDFGHVQWIVSPSLTASGMPTPEDLARYTAAGGVPC